MYFSPNKRFKKTLTERFQSSLRLSVSRSTKAVCCVSFFFVSYDFSIQYHWTVNGNVDCNDIFDKVIAIISVLIWFGLVFHSGNYMIFPFFSLRVRFLLSFFILLFFPFASWAFCVATSFYFFTRCKISCVDLKCSTNNIRHTTPTPSNKSICCCFAAAVAALPQMTANGNKKIIMQIVRDYECFYSQNRKRTPNFRLHFSFFIIFCSSGLRLWKFNWKLC